MYRRRFGRRRFQARRRRPYAKRKIFGKKATRAIKAISQRPVETKWHIYNSAILVDVPAVSWPSAPGSQFAVYKNVFQTIPRSNQVGTESAHEVIGQKFNVRGISLACYVAWRGNGSIPSTMRVRMTLLKSSTFYDVSQFQPLSTSSAFHEDDDTMPMTVKGFNTSRVTVLKSRSFTVGPQSALGSKVVKLWYPMRKTLTCYDDEGAGVLTTEVGRLKDFNYYAILEFVSVDGFGWDPPTDDLYFRTKVYFKDP